jgi:predicted RNase H-like nuclease (RuvC/YqgF family)
LNYEFSGVDIPDNDKDLYTLRYSEFVVPLVKAVQEQQDEIRALKSENNQLKHQLAAFEKRLQKLEKK